MLQPPDEAHDVICCHQPESDGSGSWVVRLGEDTLGERDSLAGAIDLTRTAAVSHRRPAWLLDESGYPLEPVIPGRAGTCAVCELRATTRFPPSNRAVPLGLC